MTEQLVLMQKDGEQLRVHPTTVKSHEEAGWKVVEQPVPLPLPLQGPSVPYPTAAEEREKHKRIPG